MRQFKIQNSKFKIVVFLIFAFLFFNFAFLEMASAELTIKANHNHIKIDFFYHGSTVSVKGTSDPNTDLVIKITAPDSHEPLKQKGKVAGLLWMNTGTLNFENVPGLYSIHSTGNINDILSSDEMDRHVIGYSALNKHIEITPVADEEEKSRWYGEFIKFKESSKLYSTSTEKVSTELKDGKQEYYILTEWPYQAPPGEYLVTVYAVKDLRVVEMAETKVKVEQVGAIKALANMAKNNGAVYGIVSILIALGAGFGVSLIFKKGGSH